MCTNGEFICKRARSVFFECDGCEYWRPSLEDADNDRIIEQMRKDSIESFLRDAAEAEALSLAREYFGEF